MKNARRWSKPLLVLHLFVCAVWLYLFHSSSPPEWTWHVIILSVVGIQFTWGFTIGLAVGPSRKRRQELWWSLLLIFMPLYFVGWLLRGLFIELGPIYFLLYLVFFTIFLASETYAGVLLGAKVHSENWEE